MAADGLFFIDTDDKPKRMASCEFETEKVFQELLAKFPELLTDSDFGEGSPRRWMLVTREAMVPDKLDGSGRWSLDHLFLDQDGVPTLVEIKRASDTRARREVVAQMLDYAANAVSWWSAEKIKGWLDVRCQNQEDGTSVLIKKDLGIDDSNQQEFWNRVKSNLGSRRIRLIFVADRIEAELETIVLFLNEQMKDTTVVALELAQFSDGTARILAPRLIGLTPKSIERKNVTVPPAESVEAWFDKVCDAGAVATSRRFLRLMERLGTKPRVAGMKSIAFDREAGNQVVSPIYLRSTGKISVSFYMLSKVAAYQPEQERKALVSEFEKAGFKLSADSINSETSFSVPPIENDERWQALEELLKKLLHRLDEPAQITHQ